MTMFNEWKERMYDKASVELSDLYTKREEQHNYNRVVFLDNWLIPVKDERWFKSERWAVRYAKFMSLFNRKAALIAIIKSKARQTDPDDVIFIRGKEIYRELEENGQSKTES